MTSGPSKARGLWLAQGLIAAFLVFMASRLAGNPERSKSGPHPGPSHTVLKPSVPLAAEKTTSPSPDPGSRSADRPAPGQARYVPLVYRTLLLLNEESYQCWDLDPRELAWLLAHQRSVLTSDLQTRPEPGGGLRILRIREGSFPSLRGLRAGDLLLDINGQELDGAFDLEDLMSDPAYSGTKGWRVQLNRAGQILTIDFRATSETKSSNRAH